MNEIQIIEQQLATERVHFAEVAAACTGSIEHASFGNSADFVAACADYFEFALQRIAGPGREAVERLERARRAEPAAAEVAWREFLHSFDEALRSHIAALDLQLTRGLPVRQWRAIARVDADSIVAEREGYARVRQTLPTGIAQAALSAFLP